MKGRWERVAMMRGCTNHRLGGIGNVTYYSALRFVQGRRETRDVRDVRDVRGAIFSLYRYSPDACTLRMGNATISGAVAIALFISFRRRAC